MSTGKLITLNKASRLTPYSADYLGLLIRKNRLSGVKKNGKWYTTKEAVEEYLERVAEASYHRQEELNVRIPALENRKALVNLKWALALAVVVILGLVIAQVRGKSDPGEYVIEKDAGNNLIIHADDPGSIGSVTVVPK